MALTFETYVSDGTQTIYTFGFEYIQKSFVKVVVNGLAVGYTLTGTYQITLAAAPLAGDVIIIRRETQTDRLVTFVDGSVLVAKDLNLSALQATHIAAEALDKAAGSLLINEAGNYTAGFRRIADLGDPVDARDAVNKQWVETDANSSVVNARAARDAAVVARTAAETAKAGADTAKAGAETAKTGAETARTGAETARAGVEAERAAAEAAQTGATTAKTAAEAAKTAAETARSGAQTAETNANTHKNSAAASVTSANTAKTGAETARTGAEAAKTAAETAKTAAETAQTGANTAKTAAETAKTAAETARTGAQTAETNANTHKNSAAASVTAAAGHVTTASGHKDSAAASATEAAGHASAAATSASEAADSAAQAASFDPSAYVAKSGATMTGALTLPASNPTADNQASRKKYVDEQIATRITQAAGDARYPLITGTALNGGFKNAKMGFNGALASGTHTIDPDNGNFGYISVTGSFTLTVPSDDSNYTAVYRMHMGSAAGTVTLSGFDAVTGAALSYTLNKEYFIYVTAIGTRKHAHIVEII